MWVILALGVVAAFFWRRLYFLYERRDRFEILILRPMSIAFGVFAIFGLFYREWSSALIWIVSWFLCAGIGQSLHPDKDSRALMKRSVDLNQAKYFCGGPLRRIETEEAQLIATSSMKLGLLVSVTAFCLAHLRMNAIISILVAFAAFITFTLISCGISIFSRENLRESTT
jgi:hypothetical protein